MRLESATAAAADSDLRVERLALKLLALAGDQSVRAIEAVASVLINQEHDAQVSEEGASSPPNAPAMCSPGPGTSLCQGVQRTETSEKLALCRRVARRAVRRSLLDPTGGANAFHRIDASPTWSKRSLPIASVGSFLFYKL